ncbi:MAG: hypothetical protein QM526_02045 [Alphaproteobacteria bacterium]|nr:hypothetical protein [Alphaproteobacteria bacterium]
MKRVSNFFFICFFIISAYVIHIPVYAYDCTDNLPTDEYELQRALEACQDIIQKEQQELEKQKGFSQKTKTEIQVIAKEATKAQIEVKTSELQIKRLNNEIGEKRESIDTLRKKLETEQSLYAELVRRIDAQERRGIIPTLLSKNLLSSFFDRINDYESINSQLESSIKKINEITHQLNENIINLSDKRVEEEYAKRQLIVFKQQVEEKKKEKESVYNLQKEVEKKITTSISARAQRIADIQNRLFTLRGAGPIQFKDALAFAKVAHEKTGIRPAFLLGLIKHESDLGKNVGTGYWYKDTHPTRDAPIFPFITKALGLDPDTTKVSANPGFGWGGAMGPAQFIPSTWVCYGGFINTKTGRCNKISSNDILTTKEDLSIGSNGTQVYRLQKFLNEHGFIITQEGAHSPGNETYEYTELVAQAVSRFQEKFAKRVLYPSGYSKGTGKVSTVTRNAINEYAFAVGPWEYRASSDVIRRYTGGTGISNPWSARDALMVSAIYLVELGANQDECKAARRYYAGGNWGSAVALSYCRAVLANAQSFQRDLDFISQ